MERNLQPNRFMQSMLVGITVLTLVVFPGCAGAPAASPTAASTPVSSTNAAVAPSSGRLAINFNLDWKYHEGEASEAEAKSFDDSKWTYVDLPHSTKFVTPEDPNAYLGVSWYRKHFTMESSSKGKKVYIEFEAAMQSADVWVNGAKLFRHVGGYTPFTIDVSKAVSYGGADNVIAVRVDSNAAPDWAPGWNGVDFQYDGGLYRDVNMYITDTLHITEAVYANKPAGGGVFVTYPAVSPSSATVEVKTNILNEGPAAQNATLVSTILDAQGMAVGSASSTASVKPGQEHDFLQDISITAPKLWSPNAPNLYTLDTSLKVEAKVVDIISTRIGIRRIAWSHDGGLRINGVRYKLPGVNMHQEIYGLGNAVPDQAIYYDVKRIKEAGLDFIRGSHYPHSPAFYDACDELGIVVLNAQTGWQQYHDTQAFKDNTLQELRDMIRRDRNHPSVVAWEASLNESDFTAAWAVNANSIVHEEYPGDQAFSAAWKYNFADIFIEASQHNVRDTSDPRPIIVDEYGDWDYGGATSTSRQKREAGDAAMLTQADNVQDGESKNMALAWFSVDGYWDYADYGGFSNYGMVRSGLVDMYRLPKFAYYFLQSQRDPGVIIKGVDLGPMVYIANQWAPNSPTTVRVYSNCEQVALSLNDKPVATQPPDSGMALLHPPFDFALGGFTPGTLKADCLIGGAQKASFTRHTPAAAAAISLQPEATSLRADASDARLVFIYVTDGNGTVVPSDISLVSLSISGPGSIVGPLSVTMKGGALATWVRAGRSAGTIILTASAPGLTPASLTLTSTTVPGLPAVPADRGG